MPYLIPYIQWQKLNHHVVRNLAHNSLKTNLSDQQQFTFTSEFFSEMMSIEYGVLLGPTLRPLMLLLYINDSDSVFK